MKRRLKKMSLNLFYRTSILCTLFFTGVVFSQSSCESLPKDVSKSELKKLLNICENEIKEQEKVLKDRQVERTQTEAEILFINVEVNKAVRDLRVSDIFINELSQEIFTKEEIVAKLKKEIKNKKKILKTTIQRINEQESQGFIKFFFSEFSFSEFFSKLNNNIFLKERVQDSINEIEFLQDRLFAGVEELAIRKEGEARIRVQKKALVDEVETKKGRREEVLNLQLKLETAIKTDIKSKAQRVEEIRSRLFEFSGGGGIPFGEAVRIAQFAERVTGVDSAFLLGLIKHESNLGKNVGTAFWNTDMHPTRDAPIFKEIIKIYGLDASKVKVSAALRNRNGTRFGWGGAMGPAQFIPSTWVCYAGFVNTRTGTCSNRKPLVRQKGLLKIGSSGSDILRIQKFFNEIGFTVSDEGAGSIGNETSTFGSKLSLAVSRFQEFFKNRILDPYGLRKGTGQVGPSTRAAINELSFGAGPWEYNKSKDIIREFTGGESASNPWKPLDAFVASAVFLSELGAKNDTCTAARRYYAGGNWRSKQALLYCRSVQANARQFQKDIDFIRN